jgi:hypothetical protein
MGSGFAARHLLTLPAGEHRWKNPSWHTGTGLHLVHAVGLCLGQVKTADKSNEITAIPTLLEMLNLQGCIVSIDSMGTQKAIAKQIVAIQGDYLLSLVWPLLYNFVHLALEHLQSKI